MARHTLKAYTYEFVTRTDGRGGPGHRRDARWPG
jgi:hypothetical protein